MLYYLLRYDRSMEDIWCLSEIKNCDNWRFIDPPVEYMEPCVYETSVKHEGRSIDYTLAGYAGVPIVSEHFRKALIGLPEVDEPYHNIVFEPVEISDSESVVPLYVMIIETQVDCVDEVRSIYSKFEENDPVRPDLAGQYKGFINLVLDSSKTDGFHIFRIKNALPIIIVSEEIKLRLEKEEISGCVFDSVNGDAHTVA